MTDTPNPFNIVSEAFWAALDGNVTCKDKTKMARADIDVIFDMDKIAEKALDDLAAAATLTTADELDDLPAGSVVADDNGAWTRRARSWWHPDGPIVGKSPQVPATLLYHPTVCHR